MENWIEQEQRRNEEKQDEAKQLEDMRVQHSKAAASIAHHLQEALNTLREFEQSGARMMIITQDEEDKSFYSSKRAFHAMDIKEMQERIDCLRDVKSMPAFVHRMLVEEGVNKFSPTECAFCGDELGPHQCVPCAMSECVYHAMRERAKKRWEEAADEEPTRRVRQRC
jgi:hypothetical protein